MPRTAAAQTATQGRVDLHAHLFMKDGLGFLFRGSFDKVTASSYRDRLHSKVDAASLEASGNAVVVVALFAHPAFVADLRQSIRLQIAKARAFVRRHPNWAIARHARQARRLLAAGKRVLIFSLEGAAGILETKQDRDEFIGKLGVAIVTPLHLVDDHFGGAARLDGFQWVANPLAAAEQMLLPKPKEGLVLPGRGLTKRGLELVNDLAARGVWVDLTHAAEPALRQMLPLLRRAKQPLLFTHTTMRAHRRNERSLTPVMLREVAKTGGVVGLLPSEDAFRDLDPKTQFCPASCRKSCRGSVHAFARGYAVMAKTLGAEAVMLGSDFNGGMRHLAPGCGTGTDFDRSGLRHMGHSGLLWRATQALGVPVASEKAQLERFLHAWEQVRAFAAVAPKTPGADAHGPAVAWQVAVGVRDSDAGPAQTLAAGLRVDKDVGVALRSGPQPAFFFGELQGDVALAGAAVPYAGVALSLVGVQARRGLVLAAARLLRVDWRRDLDLDRPFHVRSRLLEGRLRTSLGVPSHAPVAPYASLQLGTLGYEGLQGSQTDWMHGVYLAGSRFELGLSAREQGLAFRLFGSAAMDAGFIPSLGARHDGVLSAGLWLGFCPGIRFRYATEWVDAAGVLEHRRRRRSMASLRWSHW